MKTNTVITYTAAELQTSFPDAFESALEHYRNTFCNEIPWQDETIDSLKATIEAAGLTLRDWDLGAYNQGNFIRVTFREDGAEDLTGKRAFAWLENNLFGPLRISFTARNRWELAKYNRGMSERFYMAGRVKPCPLTGVCFDEDYLEALTKAIRSGDTLKDAFLGLADVYVTLVEAEYEHMVKEETFLETAEANEWQFTEDGDLF